MDHGKIALHHQLGIIDRAFARAAPSRSERNDPDSLPILPGPLAGLPRNLGDEIGRRPRPHVLAGRGEVGIRLEDIHPVHVFIPVGNITGIIDHHRVIAVRFLNQRIKGLSDFILIEIFLFHRLIQNEIALQAGEILDCLNGPNKVGDIAMVLKLLYPEKFEDISNKELTRQILNGDVLDLRSLLVSRMQMKSLAESIEMPLLHEELQECQQSHLTEILQLQDHENLSKDSYI